MLNNIKFLEFYKSQADEYRKGSETIIKDVEIYVHSIEDLLYNIDFEVLPVVNKFFSVRQQAKLVRSIYRRIPTPILNTFLPFIVQNLYVDSNRLTYLDLLINTAPERTQLFGKILYEQSPEFQFARLSKDLPHLRVPGQCCHQQVY